jgi:flagellar protein FliS
MSPSPIAAYETVQTLTADPARLVVRLYDGAERFLRQALGALAAGEATRYAEAVARAHAIIAELSSSLDRERGGEVAANLSRLYAFMLRHLTEGLIKRSPTHIEEVLEPLRELRAGFEGAVEVHGRE